MTALERFVRRCRFDAVTGCVLWTGGRTSGRGNSATYGAFWYEGRRWFAHRWAAVHIHGLDPGADTVGHCCPDAPNTLCVHHLAVQTLAANVAERNSRVAHIARQTAEQRQFWLLVQRGYEQLPEVPRSLDHDIPFHVEPEWLSKKSPVAW